MTTRVSCFETWERRSDFFQISMDLWRRDDGREGRRMYRLRLASISVPTQQTNMTLVISHELNYKMDLKLRIKEKYTHMNDFKYE